MLRQQLDQQHGLTLVELMVAMTISLILLGGVYQLFVGSIRTYGTQNELGRLQENARYASDLLAQTLRLAGYPRFTLDGNIFAGDPLDGPFAGSTAGAGTASDQITVNYMMPLAAPTAAYVVRFSVNEANRQLLRSEGGGADLPVLDGVENMQIVYGVDSDDDGSTDSYQASPTPPLGGVMVAVRVRLLMCTATELLDGDLDTQSYDVDGDGVAEIDPVDDRRLRRIFTTTIALRNVQR